LVTFLIGYFHISVFVLLIFLKLSQAKKLKI